MDQQFWTEFRRRTKAYEGSKQYQEWCWDVYRKNKNIIKEFVKWRTFLNLPSGSNADRGLAFLIYKLIQYHSIRWKSILTGIMKKASELPPKLHVVYILLLIKENELKNINEALAGRGEKHYSENILKRRADQIELFIEDLKNHLKAGGGKVSYSIRGPPPKMMPDWYLVARPENQFYKNEALEIVIDPLIEKEIATDNLKSRKVNELHELLQKHSWKSGTITDALASLMRISKLIKKEIELRNKIKDEDNVTTVHKYNQNLQKNLLGQQVQMNDIIHLVKKKHAIPNEEIYNKVINLLESLEKIIQKELS